MHVYGKCIECGVELDPGSPRRFTCSTRCRKRRQRRQADQQSAWVAALREMQKMRDGIKRGEQLQRYREQLLRLRDEINDLLVLAKDADALARQEMLEARARRLG